MNVAKNRRRVVKAIGAAGAVVAAPAVVRAQAAGSSIKVGWAISKTGPFAPGAGITQLPNYLLWVKDVNDAGGISVGGKKLPLEVVEYDDRSQSEEAVRAVERLIAQDKVDILLPPWGTGMNLAVAPTINKAGYPMIAPTFVSDKVPELVKRWNNIFVMLNTATTYAEAVVATLKDLRTAGKLGETVALAHVTDQFGLELIAPARKALAAAGFKVVSDQGYPISAQDLSPIIAEAQRGNPEAFLAFSYPPDTIGLTETARIKGFNPKVFYTAVGTAFPLFRGKFGANAEGVLGIGGWNPDSDAMRAYIKRHVELNKNEPDRWASSCCYAGLQVLQQAIEKAGSLDKAATIKAIASGTFNTIVGPVRFADNIRVGGWYVGQWQDGDFLGVNPAQPGAKAVRFPKPAWKAA
jgi:branched-chain amino acid transport system substrate-binding protein